MNTCTVCILVKAKVQWYRLLIFLKLLMLVFHFTLVIQIFYPPKPKTSFRHLKLGIQDFHMNYVLVPADKAANNVVVVLVDTNASKLQPFLSEGVVVHEDGCHTVLYFGA